MKKLPIYAGAIIMLFYLLLNWLLPSLAQALSAIVIWFVIAYIAYLIYYFMCYWRYTKHRK